MNKFSECIGRLKHSLRVSKDGEVAAALNLGKTAFSERKRRGSIPEDEIRRLAKDRPDLGIDVQWVLTGVPLLDMVGSPDQSTLGALLDDNELVLITNYRQASQEGQETLRRQASFAAAYNKRMRHFKPEPGATAFPVHEAPPPDGSDRTTSVVVHGSVGQQVRGPSHVGSIQVGGPPPQENPQIIACTTTAGKRRANRSVWERRSAGSGPCDHPLARSHARKSTPQVVTAQAAAQASPRGTGQAVIEHGGQS